MYKYMHLKSIWHCIYPASITVKLNTAHKYPVHASTITQVNKPFNFVTSNCGQCEVHVFLFVVFGFYAFMSTWLFQTLVCGLYRGCRDNERNMVDSAFLQTVFSFKYSHNNSLVCLWNHQKVIEFSNWPKWRNNSGICNTIVIYISRAAPK